MNKLLFLWNIYSEKQGSPFEASRIFKVHTHTHLNPIALRNAKIAYNFGLSDCSRVKVPFHLLGCVAQLVGHLTCKSEVLGSIPGLATYFRFSFR